MSSASAVVSSYIQYNLKPYRYNVYSQYIHCMYYDLSVLRYLLFIAIG